VLRGKNAGMFRETDKFSDSERQKFQEYLSTTYDDFISKVAKGRSKDKAFIDTIGQGRVWTGSQGKERGLVDEYGGLDKAIEIAKQIAGIPAGQGIQRVILPKPPSFFEELMNSGDDGDGDQTTVQAKQQEALMNAMPVDVRRAVRYAQLLDRSRSGEAIYMLPYDLRIR
jgi:protease-4